MCRMDKIMAELSTFSGKLLGVLSVRDTNSAVPDSHLLLVICRIWGCTLKVLSFEERNITKSKAEPSLDPIKNKNKNKSVAPGHFSMFGNIRVGENMGSFYRITVVCLVHGRTGEQPM